MYKKILFSTIALAALLAGPAGAQTAQTGGDRGFYAGFGLGTTDSNLSGATDKRDTVWKGYGGYQLNRYLGVEAGYIDLGKTTIPGASFSSKALTAAAVGTMPLTPQFALFGKLGVATVETDVNSASDNNFDPTYGMGVRYDFTRQIGLRGEWERFRVSGNPYAAKSDTDLFSVSLQYRFY